MVSQETISQNVKIDLGALSLFDTFKGLIFVHAFQSFECDPGTFTLIEQLFSVEFYDSLNVEFPLLHEKQLNVKKPTFSLLDPIIEECAFILELVLIDIEEAKKYISDNAKKHFKPKQLDILLKNVSSYEAE